MATARSPTGGTSERLFRYLTSQGFESGRILKALNARRAPSIRPGRSGLAGRITILSSRVSWLYGCNFYDQCDRCVDAVRLGGALRGRHHPPLPRAAAYGLTGPNGAGKSTFMEAAPES